MNYRHILTWKNYINKTNIKITKSLTLSNNPYNPEPDWHAAHLKDVLSNTTSVFLVTHVTYYLPLQMLQNNACTDCREPRFTFGGIKMFSCLKWRPAVELRCSSGMLTSTWLMNSTLLVTQMKTTSSGAWPSRTLSKRRLHSPKTAARRGNFGWNGRTILSQVVWDWYLEPKR